MSELKKNLTGLELESLKKLINNEIIEMARGIEFRQDKKEVMEKIQSYTSILERI